MRKGWTETTLGELVTIQKGKKPPALDVREEASHPYLTADVLRGAKCEQFVSQALTGLCIQLSGRETVLLWDGAGAGDVFKSQPGILASTMAKLEARDSLAMDDGYLYLYLNFKQVAIKSSCRGTTVPHVSPEALKAMYVSLPPLAEQKRLVDVVSSVDAYIDALQQQADTLHTARNAVLNELLSAGGDDWTETTIGDVADVIGGGTPSTTKPEFWGGEIVWLTPTEVVPQDGQLILDSKRRITKEGLRNSGAQLLPVGSVILTSRASVGFVGISGVELCTNQGFQSLVPGDSVLARFLMYWIQSNRVEFESRAAGSTFKEISRSNVKSIKIRLPSLRVQQQIVEVVSSVDEMIQSTEQAAANAKSLRSGLLSDLLSGDHEIPESYDRLLGAA